MNVLTRRAMALTGAVSLTLILAACGGSGDDAGGSNSLTITANAISGGKNAAQADWIEKWVIPQFTKAQKAKGVDVKVTFRPSGVDDEQYKTKLALTCSRAPDRTYTTSTESGSASSPRPGTSSR